MIPILYESTETAFTSNGICRLRDMLTAEVVEERNGAYELTFTYPVSGANFDQIRPGRIVAVTHDDTGEVEPFDIVSYSRAVDGVVTFHAVHISYRLAGQVVWSSSINSLSEALALFNNVSGSPFTFTSDFTSNAYMAAGDGVPRSVRQMIGGIEGSLLDTYGGELQYNRFNVALKKKRGTARGVMIRYGVNLVDYKEDTDYNGTYNAVIPYWVGQSNTGKQLIVRGSRVDYTQPTYSGRRITAPLDLTDKFESKPTAAQLQTMAASLMTTQQPTIPQQSITVDFLRLRDFPEYASIADLLTCSLCDTVGVTFPLYNMSATFKIVKTVWDPLQDRYTSMELGSLSTSLAEALGITQDANSNRDAIDDLTISSDLSVGGNATIAGDLTLSGNSTPIGSVLTETESISIPTGSGAPSARGTGITLPKGGWDLDVSVSYPANASGVRRIGIGTTAIFSGTRTGCPALSGGYDTLLHTHYAAEPTASVAYRLYAQQNSGSTLTATVIWRARRVR